MKIYLDSNLDFDLDLDLYLDLDSNLDLDLGIYNIILNIYEIYFYNINSDLYIIFYNK